MVGVVFVLQLPSAALRATRHVERGARRRVGEVIGEVTLAVVDASLSSPYADEVVERVLNSALAERVVGRALEGELLAGIPKLVAEHLLAEGLVEQVTLRVLEGPELERVVEVALQSPGAERVMLRVLESGIVEQATMRVIDDTTERLRRSPGVWTLVEEIAASPAVTDAITRQGVGFADQVTEEIRERSSHADERLERAARRLLRRRSPGGGGAPSTSGAG